MKVLQVHQQIRKVKKIKFLLDKLNNNLICCKWCEISELSHVIYI